MSQLSEFVPLAQVARLTGLHPRAVDRRIAEGVVQLFVDPFDRRRRLVHREDVQRFVELIPVRRADSVTDLAVSQT